MRGGTAGCRLTAQMRSTPPSEAPDSPRRARTARNHLRILGTVACLPIARADEVLELVGLRDAAWRKIRGCSMGCGSASDWPPRCSETRG